MFSTIDFAKKFMEKEVIVTVIAWMLIVFNAGVALFYNPKWRTRKKQ